MDITASDVRIAANWYTPPCEYLLIVANEMEFMDQPIMDEETIKYNFGRHAIDQMSWGLPTK